MGRACLMLLAIAIPCFLLKAVTGVPDNSNIPILKNFNFTQFGGKWYSIAWTSDSLWLRMHQHLIKMNAYTLAETVEPGKVSASTWHSGENGCQNLESILDKLEPPGRFGYSYEPGRFSLEFRVVQGKPSEYATTVFYSFGENNTDISFRLWGRKKELRPAILEEYRRFSLDRGYSKESVFIFRKADECVPGQPSPVDSQQPRVQRSVVLQTEEGSGMLATNSPFRIDVEASCQLPADAGMCFGHHERFYYNQSTMTCGRFIYGGCSGNGNNFQTERVCLQSCRTVATCRLPVIAGPCRGAIHRWGFDSNLGKCKQFNYSGCQGNGNRFYSLKECEEYCDAIPAEEADLLVVQNTT